MIPIKLPAKNAPAANTKIIAPRELTALPVSGNSGEDKTSKSAEGTAVPGAINGNALVTMAGIAAATTEETVGVEVVVPIEVPGVVTGVGVGVGALVGVGVTLGVGVCCAPIWKSLMLVKPVAEQEVPEHAEGTMLQIPALSLAIVISATFAPKSISPLTKLNTGS